MLSQSALTSWIIDAGLDEKRRFDFAGLHHLTGVQWHSVNPGLEIRDAQSLRGVITLDTRPPHSTSIQVDSTLLVEPLDQVRCAEIIRVLDGIVHEIGKDLEHAYSLLNQDQANALEDLLTHGLRKLAELINAATRRDKSALAELAHLSLRSRACRQLLQIIDNGSQTLLKTTQRVMQVFQDLSRRLALNLKTISEVTVSNGRIAKVDVVRSVTPTRGPGKAITTYSSQLSVAR
jgi:hypothetical protein